MASETSPLLGIRRPSRDNLPDTRPFWERFKEQPGFSKSFRYFIFSSWFNILLVFVPLGAVSHFLDWDATLRFAFNFMAIMPLAAVRSISWHAKSKVSLVTFPSALGSRN